ncbi:MAG: hypothetical protein VX938_03410 [Myxococcota bacterium]|nr:hypothetical protein [Myxococcota bacterium]
MLRTLDPSIRVPLSALCALLFWASAGACTDEATGAGGSSGGGDSVSEDSLVAGGDVATPDDTLADAAPEDTGSTPSDTTTSDGGQEPNDSVPGDASDTAGDATDDDVTSDALSDATGGLDATDVIEPEDTKPGFTVDVKPVDTAQPLEDTSPPSDVADPNTPDADEPGGSGWDPAIPWLLTVDNSSNTLQKVNVETAETIDVCVLGDGTPPGGLLAMPTYPSLTFSRFNGLYASQQGGSLDQIDPCTCEVTPIGPYGDYSGIYGITSDEGDNLYGVATVQDWLVAISTNNGNGHGVGPLGYDFTTAGATWSDLNETLFAINGGTDGLYTIEPTTGVSTLLSSLDYDFGTVGIELHPANGVIYACSSDAHLLSVDLDGKVTDIGDMGQGGSCTNLAAPWLPVPCLDNL